METNQISGVGASVDEHLAYLAGLAKSVTADTAQGSAGDDVFYVTNSGDKIIESANGGTDSVYSKVSYTLGNHLENLTLGGTENIYGAGNNLNNTLIGNSGHNRLNSGRGNDTVYGGNGNDTINGGEGNDMLFGDAGNDTLNGEAGNDTLQGGAGNDVYIFGKNGGQDTIIDNEGTNSIRFSDGITADDLTVSVSSNANGGQDWKITVNNTGAVLTISNQYQSDANLPAVKNFVFNGKTMNVAAFAEAVGIAIDTPKSENQTINGTSGNDTLEGGSGDDTLNGMAGADTMRGYAGDDTYYVDNAGDVVIEEDNAGNDTVISSISYTAPTDVENVTLTGSANLFAAGNNENNILTGNAGSNRLNSGRGDDTVYGMDGNDRINGGAGNDTLSGGKGNDVIYGEEGNDTLSGDEGTDILNGGAGDDVYIYGSDDTVVDSQGNDTLKFSDGMTVSDVVLNVISNSDGSKTWQITSPTGSVTLQNQVAADGSYSIENFSFGTQTLTASAFLAAAGSGSQGQTITGTADNDVIQGTEYADTITTGDKQDTVYGNGGDDVITDDGQTYYGTETDDKLYGNDGDDKIYADVGNDILDGGAGNDHLEGGQHSDTYVFGRGYGKDTLFDFNFTPDDEYLLHRSNANTVTFTDGLTLDDLEITISNGYNASLVKNMPSQADYLSNPITDGNTWTIRIKDTDDVLTILNQNPTLGAADIFKFDSASYTAAQVFNSLGMTPDEIIAANKDPLFVADSSSAMTVYGTDGNDNNLNDSNIFGYRTEYNSGTRTVYGGAGNDSVTVDRDDGYEVVFYGGSGNDSVSMGAQSVVFDGGTGDDSVSSSSTGELTHIFRAGDGHDTIELEEQGGEIQFTGGLTLDDLTIVYTSESAVITLKDTGDTVTIGTTYASTEENTSYSVENIRFDSGATATLSDIAQLGANTVSSSALSATVNTSAGNSANATAQSSLLDDTESLDSAVSQISSNTGTGTIGLSTGASYAAAANNTAAVSVTETSTETII